MLRNDYGTLMKNKKAYCLRASIAIFLLACLLVVTGDPLPAGAQPQDKTNNKYANCIECHDYGLNHHPVDIQPFGEVPFPLTNGKITCTTCHFSDHETGGRNFLREGPYLQQRDICFKCHHKMRYEGLNPHDMLDKDRKIKKIIGGQPVCIVCHVNTPNPQTDKTEDVEFRADVGFLCWRCHPPMANALFQSQHLLVSPSLEMQKVIEKNEKAMNIVLPLVPRNRVTCSTCHNPHQKGVIVRDAAAKGAGSDYRLRIPSPRLCFICHPF